MAKKSDVVMKKGVAQVMKRRGFADMRRKIHRGKKQGVAQVEKKGYTPGREAERMRKQKYGRGRGTEMQGWRGHAGERGREEVWG